MTPMKKREPKEHKANPKEDKKADKAILKEDKTNRKEDKKKEDTKKMDQSIGIRRVLSKTKQPKETFLTKNTATTSDAKMWMLLCDAKMWMLLKMWMLCDRNVKVCRRRANFFLIFCSKTPDTSCRYQARK